MINPYKKLSIVEAQIKSGYRKIVNVVFIALQLAPLSAAEYKVIMAVIHFTWGWGQDSEFITYSQLSFYTNLTRDGVIKTVKKLIDKRILLRRSKLVDGCLPLNEYQINKYYDTWMAETDRLMYTTTSLKLVYKMSKTGIQNVSQLVDRRTPPIKRIRKERKIRKENPKPKSSFYAEQIKQDMENKKPLKMGDTEMPEFKHKPKPEEPDIEPF